MKAFLRISIILNLLLGGFILMRGSELLTKEYLAKQQRVQETKQSHFLHKEQKTQNVYTQEAAETVRQGNLITCDTEYTVSKYDVFTGREETEQELLPASFISMNREKLLTWIDDYNRSASLKDLEEGFLSMELVSFSSEKVHVRKRYDSSEDVTDGAKEEPKSYEHGMEQDGRESIAGTDVLSVSENAPYYGCILAQDGLLVVYDGQKRHVILYTDISLSAISIWRTPMARISWPQRHLSA